MTMKVLSVLYAAFLILFCLQTTFLIMATAHEVDLSFLIINSLSVAIFVVTAYFLSKFYFSKARRSVLLILMFFVVMIFGYYCYDIFSKGDIKNIFAYQPLVGLLLGMLILAKLAFQGRNRVGKI
ncbi:hypothetical protein LQ567_16950 [Niabella pedocola]|uniref:Uncharacterized protein n=1 Tax=Niabella pedocola TaxID=1752077 RepID=A0ABS8PTR3_9BACT|nr:hypothetical protein [Niabella pedocola]MCD2424471.1 hypothetical protein [Niabella pedocola]